MVGWLVSSILAISRSVTTIKQSFSSSSTDPRNGMEEDLRELGRTLERIQAVLHDAEEREIQGQTVKLWLSELRVIAYDTEDVLEEYHYEVLRSEADARAATAKASRKRKLVEEGKEDLQEQVCELVSPSSSSSSKVSIPDGMADKIREIRMRFDEIARDRDALQLRSEDGERRFECTTYPPPYGSLVDDTGVFGREDDKKKVMELLFSDEGCCFSVIPIVGMPGLGKTTLAQLVYKDPKIASHFDLTGWVFVSVDFDILRLIRGIIESISNDPCDLTELSSLQDKLRKKLEGKTLLLVLDDVWNEKESLWESLRVALLAAKWVRVIVTTRNDSVAEMMQTVPPYKLGGLAEDQCRLLFRKHAFGTENPQVHEKLVEIGEKIIKKCAGLPLAVKALGCVLRGKTYIKKWEEVLESDIWELGQGEDEILPALRLSYHRLPTYLKPCFVYCSMFPKSQEIEKDELIRQWMAQGYIQPRGRSSLEDTGSEYFNQLLRRSFFQMPTGVGKKERFVIHDVMVDLARSISGEDRCGVTWREARHSYAENEKRALEMMDNLSSCHKLRAFFVPRQYDPQSPSLGRLMKMLNLEYLRALSLVRIEWLRDPIGTMKHLRYLGLNCESVDVLPGWLYQLYNLQTLELKISHSELLLGGMGSLVNLRYLGICCSGQIKKFPQLHNLHNLWTLDLSHCFEMKVLPSGIGDLINLRHLFLPFAGTHESMEKLTNLRSLSNFNVTRCNGIGNLKGMIDLGGTLEIRGLQNVGSAAEAGEANLKGKQDIKDLYFYWDCGDDAVVEQELELEAAVLESLQPHNHLNTLMISNYRGTRFPSWIADPSFSKLTCVELILFRNTSIVFLPPLGRLPALRSLFLQGLHGVRCIGHEFSCGLQGEDTTTAEVGFPSLEKLEIIHMDGLEMWNEVQEGDFPHLESLEIQGCPKLTRLPTLPLLQSRTLKIICCCNLSSIPLQQHSGRSSKLRELHIVDCPNLNSVVGLNAVDSLERLKIIKCRALPFFPGELPSNIRVRLET